jgi:alpha-L-rhamnosidase
VYQRYGDKRILEENYEAMVGWIDYQEKTSTHLLRPPTNYGDWLAIDAVTPQQAPVPSDLVGTAYFAHTTGLMAQIAALLGQKADAARFRRLHARLVKTFRSEYVTPAGRVVGDCQTGYLLALSFDLLPEKLRPKAVERLVELIRVRDWHLTTGFVGTPLLCPVLTRFGRTDVAYKLLFQDTYPSWLYPIRNGATTMWERWNSYTKEHGFGPVAMNSFNHYAYGAIGEWIYQVVGGVRLVEPGYREVLIAPEPDERIDWAKTSIDTPHGLLACEWRRKPRSLEILFTVPGGSTAEVRLPTGYQSKEKNSGWRFGPGTHRLVGQRSKG